MKKLLIIGLTIFSSVTYAFSINFKLMPRKNEIKLYGAARMFMDGSTPASCDGYRNPVGNKFYSGDVGDGLYMIKPDAGAAFAAYCDMTTDTSGWTLIFAGGMLSPATNPPLSIYSGSNASNISMTVMGVTLTTQDLMNVVNRVGFSTVRFGTDKWMISSNSSSTFNQKYTARTSWSSHNCQTTYLSVQRASVAGWDVSLGGSYTVGSALLGCTTAAFDPSTPQDGGTLDYSIVGLNVYASATGAACDQGGCNVYHLLGTTGHRAATSFAGSTYMQSKSTLMWIK